MAKCENKNSKFLILTQGDNFSWNNINGLRTSFLYFSKKKPANSLQSIIFGLTGAQPTKESVLKILESPISRQITQGKTFPQINYKGYELDIGFFRRLLFSGDEVFKIQKKKWKFFVESDGVLKEVKISKVLTLMEKLKLTIVGM